MAKNLFGVLAVRKGLVTESEVDVALEAQRDDGGPKHRIGEILVDMGTLTPDSVKRVLEDQDAGSPTSRLRQQSGPSIRVNGDLVAGSRTLKAGDRVDVGAAVFAVEGELEVHATAEPPTASTTEMPTAPPPPIAAATEAPKEPAKPSVFARADAVFARVLPAIHNHRKYLALALLPGLLALVLPWRLAAEERWIFGIQGPGWPTFLLTAFALAFALLGPRPKALLKPEKILILSLTGLALLLSLWKLFFPPAYALAMGIGLPLAALSAIAATLSAALADAQPGVMADTAFGLAKNLGGKKQKEKAAATERRDELLRQVGEVALETKGGPPADLEAAAKAKTALDGAKGPALKPAEAKLRRALLKLGRIIVDQNLALDGRTLPTAEVKDLDLKLKEMG